MYNEYFNESCLKTMQRMKTDCIDLVVTSPPYDNLRTYSGHDINFNFKKTAKLLYRVMKNNGVIVWIVGDQTLHGNESLTSFKQALYFQKLGFKIFDTMIYQKTPRGAVGNDRSYWQTFEYMFIISKRAPRTINLLKDRKNVTEAKSAVYQNRKPTGESRKGRAYQTTEYGRRGNVWLYHTGGNMAKDKIAFQHPAIMPDKLARDHILSWSNPGDVVYDPFAGSGTVLKQAKILNRNFIGSEINTAYCKIIKARLNTLEDYI